MATTDDHPDSEMVEVFLLDQVFSTGKTPEATYTPRIGNDPDGTTFDEKFRGKTLRRAGGVMLYGVSKSGKTSLVERVLPEGDACWIQGTRISSIDDFWSTLAHQLQLNDRFTTEESEDESKSDTVKGEAGFRPVAMGSLSSEDKSSSGSRRTWSYSTVVSQHVEDHLTAKPVPIIVDDFHHIDAPVREDIAKAIKPLLRKTFVALIAIPSHSFDPAKAASDIGGRMVKFRVPEWTMGELVSIANRGFEKLRLIDENDQVATALAKNSFGSPHVMQELCYTLLSKNKIRESPREPIQLDIPGNLATVVRDAATESEPFAFQDILSGRNTKGEARKPISLVEGGHTDSYGITLMAIRDLIPPLNLRFKTIREKVSELADQTVAKERIVTALRGMSAVADDKKGNADPIFSYRDEVAYIEDPMLAFYLKFGDWQPDAMKALTEDGDEGTLF
ncbi:hypothetical protein [Gordonia terrae]|uniref:hypothetical protein n=1 Tax=Gordonia terrae TaxID=2055 RepID=UPI003F6D2926